MHVVPASDDGQTLRKARPADVPRRYLRRRGTVEEGPQTSLGGDEIVQPDHGMHGSARADGGPQGPIAGRRAGGEIGGEQHERSDVPTVAPTVVPVGGVE